MIAGGNVNGKWSGKKMEGDNGLRTLECLRGRLLAERVASRAAKEDAEQMGNKLIELENQLRIEIKSRNRAEKRLKFLVKKLESLNISYVSEDTQHSSLLGKSDMSSVSSSSSTASSGAKDPQTQITTTNPAKCGIEESMKKTKCPTVSTDLEDNVSQSSNSSSSTSNQGHCSAIEESLSCAEKADSVEPPSEPESSRNYNNPKTDDHSSKMEKEDINEGNSDEAEEDEDVDNSLALVPAADLPQASLPTDPLIVDARIKDVLQALRDAREKLQWTMMERTHIIRVGSK